MTVEHIPSRTPDQPIKNLNKVIKSYGRGGFIIRVILMYMEFDNMDKLLENFEVNIKAAREHVVEVDRIIRTAK